MCIASFIGSRCTPFPISDLFTVDEHTCEVPNAAPRRPRGDEQRVPIASDWDSASEVFQTPEKRARLRAPVTPGAASTCSHGGVGETVGLGPPDRDQGPLNFRAAAAPVPAPVPLQAGEVVHVDDAPDAPADAAPAAPAVTEPASEGADAVAAGGAVAETGEEEEEEVAADDLTGAADVDESAASPPPEE